MKPRLAAILFLLVVVPVAALAALSWRLAAAERDANAHRIREVMTGLLRSAESTLIEHMRDREARLTALLEGLANDPEAIRERVRRDPGVEQVFLVGRDGTLAYPSTRTELTRAEQAFLERTASLWEGKAFYHHARQPVTTDAGMSTDTLALAVQNVFPPTAAGDPLGVQAPAQQAQVAVQVPAPPRQEIVQQQEASISPRQQSAAPPAQKFEFGQAAPNGPARQRIVQQEAGPPVQQQAGPTVIPGAALNAPAPQQMTNYGSLTGARSRGWYSWYWDNAMRLAFFEARPDGAVAGAELNPTRLIADLIALLPATDPANPTPSNARIVLADASGRPLYGWGGYLPDPAEQPRVFLPLNPPLAGWRLDYFAPADASAPAVNALRVLAPVAAVGLALLLLGLWFYRESTRELREAATRISFVNQVSHELKTPLTNIRMYAELLDGEIDDGDEGNGTARRYLGIVTTEIGRLSRLITNILTFSRSQRNKLTLTPSPAEPDAVIASVLEQFGPSLAAAGIVSTFEPGAPGAARIDADALGQVVGNLIGNVEKYAASGGRVTICTRRDGDTLVATVTDNGPGIPRGERERVFEPFHRVSNRLTDGVAGTGIGLTIARELARLHGGDLRLVPSDHGATFELTIHAPRETAS